MGTFRGSDETLDAEIAAVETIVRIRLRRYSTDMKDLDRDLRELRAERAKRRAEADATAEATSASSSEVVS